MFNKNEVLNTKKIMWKDIQIGDKFLDGSEVKSIHEKYMEDCYSINDVVLSSTHLLLCDISKTSKNTKKWIEEEFGKYLIPTLFDRHVYFENLDETLYKYEDENRSSEDGLVYMTHKQIQSMLTEGQKSKYEVIKSDPCKVDENIYWLNVETINNLVKVLHEKIFLVQNYNFNNVNDDVNNNNNDNNDNDNSDNNNGKNINSNVRNFQSLRCKIKNNYNIMKIKNINYVGQRDVFCVETDSHKFETCKMIHHNSVTLRNIILHCLTHGQQISIGLVDLKFTEFTFFKGVNNVVAVANTVQEACELLRLMRQCMYTRNEEMSKLYPPINDIKDFKPKSPTNEYMIYNRKFNGDDEVEIKLKNGEIKKVKVKEIKQYLE